MNFAIWSSSRTGWTAFPAASISGQHHCLSTNTNPCWPLQQCADSKPLSCLYARPPKLWEAETTWQQRRDSRTSGLAPVEPNNSSDEADEHEDRQVDQVSGTPSSIFSHRYFKLVPLECGEATIEIDGVKMHITQDRRPSQDAAEKVRLARVRKGSSVLDVCTGLGYSAIAAARAGAASVITLEANQDVLDLAAQNPLSAELFFTPTIEIRVGDANESIKELASAQFSCILHDPPRMSHAGELYGLAFFKQLCRVLKDGGRLVMYTGTHRSRSGVKTMPRGVKDRLLAAGFAEVRFMEQIQGFVAMKL